MLRLRTVLRASYARGIASTTPQLKRKGGASALTVKSSSWNRSKGNKSVSAKSTKQKLKQDTAPHLTPWERKRELKREERENAYNAREWKRMEQDEELNKELDAVFDYLNNSGPQGDYVYEEEKTLEHVNAGDALQKLNAIARKDPDVMNDMQELQSDRTELHVDDYNFLMKVYASQSMCKEANALLTRMEKNFEHKETLVESSGADVTDLQLLEELDAVPHVMAPDARTYMLYATALGMSGQAAPAVRVLGRMKERGVLPDVAMYNAVMRACAKGGRVTWAYNVMEKMQVAGLVPDRASFTILVNAAIAENDVDKAFETFNLMRSHVADPDEVAFNCIINGFARVGRVEKALNLFEDLLECGLTPSLVTFNTLMNACAKSHYYAHKAVDFYYEMQELYDYIPDLYSYNTVLHACAKHGDFIQAEQIIRHMEKHQVPMNEMVYSTLFNVYARAQIRAIVDKAPRNQKAPAKPEPIYQEPTEWNDDGNLVDLTRPGKETFSLANANYDGRFDDDVEEEEEAYKLNDEALREVEALRQKDKAQHEEMLNADTTELTQPERSMEVYGEEDERLFADSEESLNFELVPMDLSNFGKFQTLNIKRAESRFHEMTFEKGITPSLVTLNSMLGVYANALRLRSAEVFLNETFPKYDQKPDKFAYRVMMQMYVRAKRTPQAEAVLERMRADVDNGDLDADEVVYGLLVDHYARKRLLRRALATLEDADAHGIQLQETHLKKVRQLTERYGVFTDLIPEDPNAVIFAGSRHKLMEKRKVRAEVIEYNRKIGKRYLLPETV